MASKPTNRRKAPVRAQPPKHAVASTTMPITGAHRPQQRPAGLRPDVFAGGAIRTAKPRNAVVKQQAAQPAPRPAQRARQQAASIIAAGHASTNKPTPAPALFTAGANTVRMTSFAAVQTPNRMRQQSAFDREHLAENPQYPGAEAIMDGPTSKLRDVKQSRGTIMRTKDRDLRRQRDLTTIGALPAGAPGPVQPTLMRAPAPKRVANPSRRVNPTTGHDRALYEHDMRLVEHDDQAKSQAPRAGMFGAWRKPSDDVAWRNLQLSHDVQTGAYAQALESNRNGRALIQDPRIARRKEQHDQYVAMRDRKMADFERQMSGLMAARAAEHEVGRTE